MNLYSLNLKQAIDGLKKSQFTSFELVKSCIDRISKTEKKLNSFVFSNNEKALEEAKLADKKIQNRQFAPLAGIPIAIKDNFCTKDIKTTASSKVLADFVPPFDATVVKKLKENGAIIIGKTNLDAWAHGSSTETSDFGTSKNPWNQNFLPGGSSGGSAAAVSSDQTIAAIGSETAGSIRQPAAWCGVVGLKPTYGRVSRYGLIAMASSLDCPGPITKTVWDAAKILETIAGNDIFDATSLPDKTEKYTKSLDKKIEKFTIGVSDDYFKDCQNQVSNHVLAAVKVFEKNGARIKKIDLLAPKYSIAVYTILQRSEVSSNLARYDGIRFGLDRSYFGQEAKKRILLGVHTLSSGYYDQYYTTAQKIRTIIISDFKKAFEKVDVIIAPTSPSEALPVGSSKNHPMFGEMADVLVEPSTIAGLPGINIPCGFSEKGLPIGMQIIGPQLSESLILNIAQKFEKETDWHKAKPVL